MKLTESYQNNHTSFNNRVVMAPMTRSRADNNDNAATPLIAEYYAQRASAGLIISEGAFVNDRAIGYINVPSIYTPEQIEGWKTVTAAVHKKGGKIFAQLWHVGRISHPDLLRGKLPLAPSAINAEVMAYTPEGFKPTPIPQEMTQAEIGQTVLDFQKAALNAIEAGFDGVELHAANGYLFHQFFMKCSNTRTDEYGGSIENRSRFLFDVLDKIREVLPLSQVGVRLAPGLNRTFGITADMETLPLFEYVTERLNDYDLAYLHISGFSNDKMENPLEYVLNTATHFRKIYSGTLIINKGFDRETANAAIENGVADMVSFGEPYISNPDLVERFVDNLPLTKPERETYYTPGAKGFTDYPFAVKK